VSDAPSPHVPLRHLALAVAVTAVWGTNFVVMKVAIAVLPPLCLAALRFLLVLLPAALLLPRPPVPWRHLAGYGLLIGVGQFGVLYVAMMHDISPGLASLVVQMQVFFTIGLSMLWAGERVRGFQVLALLLACAGLGVIALHTDGSTTPLGLLMVLLAAFSWAAGNMVSKRSAAAVAARDASAPLNMLAYVVWSSWFAWPPLALLSLLIEGPAAVSAGLQAADAGIWLAVAWQAVGNSLFGYAAWGWLLARHPAAAIVPMALLVPVFGIAASAGWLGETLPAWKLIAVLLVMGGLALNVLWPRIVLRWAARAA
jgi:O-acetylserine/cysteine efflux transporter